MVPMTVKNARVHQKTTDVLVLTSVFVTMLFGCQWYMVFLLELLSVVLCKDCGSHAAFA